MDKSSKIYVTGHTGLVGSALLDVLREKEYRSLVYKTSKDLDLRDPRATRRFFEAERPQYVFHAAALVGGIEANRTRPGEFILDNLAIQTNIFVSARNSGVEKLLFFGSNCMYPRECPQPMKEEYLGTGRLEPTNVAFATAKLAGMTMCQSFNLQYGTNFITAVPANLFGPRDNFDLAGSHFFPAAIMKFHDAKNNGKQSVTFWGTGNPRRETLYVKDVADASLFLMDNYSSSEPINIGTNKDYSIKEIAEMLKVIVGFEGAIEFDASKPDGMPRKLLDSSKIWSMGWMPTHRLREASNETYSWFLENKT